LVFRYITDQHSLLNAFLFKISPTKHLYDSNTLCVSYIAHFTLPSRKTELPNKLCFPLPDRNRKRLILRNTWRIIFKWKIFGTEPGQILSLEWGQPYGFIKKKLVAVFSLWALCSYSLVHILRYVLLRRTCLGQKWKTFNIKRMHKSL
jgi:hypothetical protein